MSAVRKRLRDDIRLDILYEDRTLYGSALSGRAEAFLKRVCSGIADYRKRNGTAATVAHSRELLDELFSRELAPLYRTRDALSDDCLFPADDRVWPAALSVGSVEGVRDTIPLSRGNIGELASWLFEIQCGTTR